MDAVRYGSVSGDGDTRAREGRLRHYQLGLTQHLQRTNTVYRGWDPHPRGKPVSLSTWADSASVVQYTQCIELGLTRDLQRTNAVSRG